MKKITILLLLLADINLLQAETIPDLTKGEGPTLQEAAKNDWFLHCDGCHGWAYRDKLNTSDSARQILVTKVPAESAVRRDLKVGDVILGVNGKPFSDSAIRQFRDVSHPAQFAKGQFSVILWRRGWNRARNVTLSLATLPLDFTKGDAPGDCRDFNLGPTGARGWIQSKYLATSKARQILVTSIEKGSPADGLLKANDVILGTQGKPFESDARKVLAGAIRRAETEQGKGRLELMCWRDGKTEAVTITLPVLGEYSPSAPFDCEKSKKIVDAAANYIVTNGMGNGINGCVNALGLLATGEEKYLPAVKEFAMRLKTEETRMPTWHLGYTNMLLAEYYLATGDKEVLPKVRKISQTIAEGQSIMGTLGHGFAKPENGILPAYGAVNQCSLSAMISLALARKCGVTSDAIELAVKRAAIFFSYYIDKGAIAYGDHSPYLDTHDNNGVCSSAAVFFDLIEDDPGAGYFSRMATASYGIRESGHTGHFWSHLWAAPGVNRAGKKASAAFLGELWWYFDLERQWDGGFGYQAAPGSKGDSTWGWDCTGARLLAYTLPRGKIYLTGRGMTNKDRLTGDALKATIDAGRGVNWGNRKTIYGGRPKDELFELLGSWSPIVRARAAMSLGKQPATAAEELLELYRTGDTNQKLGALVALRHQGTRAAKAVPMLTQLLTHKDSKTRIAAINALQGIGSEAKSAVPELLRVARMTFPDDPRNLTRRNIGYVIFNDALLDVKTVDRKELFATARDLIHVDDGRAREHVAWLYKKLSFNELKPILPDILWAVKNSSPSGTMFAAGIRDAGLKLLSDNRVEEAIPLLVHYARDQEQWGSQRRIVQIMGMLELYGAHAKPVLPALRKMTDYFRAEPGFPEWARQKKVEAMEASIKRIEAATEKPRLTRIADR